MSTFFQLFLAWGVLLLVILVMYLIDKINVIYQKHAEEAPAPVYSDGLFGELVGKALWDAMSGIPLPGFDPKLITDLKPHYEPVLRQHIEQTFMQGVSDQQQNRVGVPINNRMLPTPRGSVESWLPLHHLSSLYQCGVDHAVNDVNDRLRVQQSLDQIAVMLYARTGLELKDPISLTLLTPHQATEPDASADANQAAAQEAAPDAAGPDTPAALSQATQAAPATDTEPEPMQELEPQGLVLGQNLGQMAKPVPA